MINSEIRGVVEGELRSGEKLLWADKPAKFPLSFMAIYITGFSIVWTLMAIGFVGVGLLTTIVGPVVAETGSEAAGGAAFGLLFVGMSLFFVCIGAGMILWGLKMLIGPSREIYALTNQRGIIISPFMRYRIASLSPESLRNSERKGNPELGTLTFTNKSTGWMAMWMNPYQTELSAFQKIENPKMVENLIHKTFFGKGLDS